MLKLLVVSTWSLHLQAYAVFTYGNEERTSSDALRRLFAMEEFSDLGSAFDLAKRDLEIRGAGAMYGIEQSGTVNGVGVDLYMEYLRDSVDEWKIIERYTYAADPKILLSKNAPSIPIKYIADDGEHAAALASVHAAKSLEDLLEVSTSIIVVLVLSCTENSCIPSVTHDHGGVSVSFFSLQSCDRSGESSTDHCQTLQRFC